MFIDEQHMRLVHISLRYEHLDELDGVLTKHRVVDYVRHPRREGAGAGAANTAPGSPERLAVVEALVHWSVIEPLLMSLRRFRAEKGTLRAAILPIEAAI